MMSYRDLSGKLHRESSGTDDYEDAKRRLRQKDHSTDCGMLITPDVGKVTVSDGLTLLVNHHRALDQETIKMRGRIAKHLLPYFGPRRLLATISSDAITAYRAHRRAATPPAAVATINRELGWLRQMFLLSIAAGKLTTRPKISLPKEHNARQGFFEPAQIAAVLTHLPADLRPPVHFAFLSGWRITSEVLTRQWRHVDFAKGTIRIEPGEAKNDEPREIFLTQALRSLLEQQRAAVEALRATGTVWPWVFFRMVAQGPGGPKAPRPIKSLLKAFKAACADAGYPGRLPHDLRRSAVRQYVRQGLSETVAMKHTGHKTSSVFRRYDITSEDDMRAAARLIDQQHATAKTSTR